MRACRRNGGTVQAAGRYAAGPTTRLRWRRATTRACRRYSRLGRDSASFGVRARASQTSGFGTPTGEPAISFSSNNLRPFGWVCETRRPSGGRAVAGSPRTACCEGVAESIDKSGCTNGSGRTGKSHSLFERDNQPPNLAAPGGKRTDQICKLATEDSVAASPPPSRPSPHAHTRPRGRRTPASSRAGSVARR